MITTLRNDLESRRRAIARALRAGMNNSSSTARRDVSLQETVASLSRRVEELSRDVDTLRAGTTDTLAARVPMTAPAVEEEPANRVAVPPITPAKLNNRAFDVLLGTVGEKQPAQSSSV